MNDCLHALENSPDAAPTDKRFAAWIRIQRVVEECCIEFSLDDPGSTASLNDARIQRMLRGYEGQLQSLMTSMKATPGVLNGRMEIRILPLLGLTLHQVSLKSISILIISIFTRLLYTQSMTQKTSNRPSLSLPEATKYWLHLDPRMSVPSPNA